MTKNLSRQLAITGLVVLMPVLSAFGEESRPLTTFMKNSGWCWYQNPRAIIHNDKLVIGGVEGNGDGAAAIGVYDLKAKEILGRVVVHERFDRDDHNSPVFWARPDGRLLAVYARHGRDMLHRYRISDPTDYLKWSEEELFRHSYPRAAKVTYMNLYEMIDEGKLYNFFRGIKWSPSFITSTDKGETWGEPTHFLAGEFKGRPYVRYTGNGKDTIHFSFTDAHPRDFGNSVYYAAFRGGKFYRANGQMIKDLKASGHLKPSEADRVFKGGGGKGRGVSKSALNSGWNSSIAIAPGYMATDNTAALQADEERNRQILERIAAGRWGNPPVFFWHRPRQITYRAPPSPSMVAGYHDK